MKASNHVLAHLACVGLAVSGFQAGVLPAAGQVAASRPQATEQAMLGAFPDSPGAVRFPQQDQPQQGGAQQPSTTQPSPTPSTTQTTQPQSAVPPQRPVGTAAAETANPSGIAASQPAGVAIAPAKQHRVRTIVLRTGAIVGAGVAIGTIVSLTAATPSKPPGAH